MEKSFTNKENIEKFKQWKETGDSKIREELIIGNMAFAEKIASFMATEYHLDLEELTQYAYIALIDAIDSFDLTTQNSFSTFATKMIFRSLKNCFQQIFGMQGYKFIYQYMCIKKILEGKSILSNQSEFAEDMFHMLVEKEVVSERSDIETMNHIYLLNIESIDFDSDNRVISNFDLSTIIHYMDLQKTLDSVLYTLTHVEREILIYKFGLNPNTFLSQSMETTLGMNRKMINRIEKKALRKLRCKKIRDILLDFYNGEYLQETKENFIESSHEKMDAPYDEDYSIQSAFESILDELIPVKQYTKNRNNER